MSQSIIGGLLSTPAPTAPIVGIAFIVLFVIVGVMVGPDYDGMNAPSINSSKETNQNWLFPLLNNSVQQKQNKLIDLSIY